MTEFANIIISIKNNLTKIFGPYGFQESGALAFDNIIDFHDYISLYLIFIFVLVSWVLFYSLNITKYSNFTRKLVIIWYTISGIPSIINSIVALLVNIGGLLHSNLFKNLNTINKLFAGIFENNNYSLYKNVEFSNIIFISSFFFNILSTSIYIILYFFTQVGCFVNKLVSYGIESVMGSVATINEFLINYNLKTISILNSRTKNESSSVKFIGLQSKSVITLYLYFSSIETFQQEIKMNYTMVKSIPFQLFMQIVKSTSMDFSKELSKIDVSLKGVVRRSLNRFSRRLTHASFLEIIWTIFPSIILLLIAVPSLILLYQLDAVAPVSLGVKIIGRQWYWSYSIGSSFPIFQDLVQYQLPAFSNWDSYMVADESSSLRLLEVDNPLFLPAGVPITLFITASDVIHSWALPALGIKVDAIPGRLNQVSFTIYDTGVFYGQCSELCGVNHGFMPIQLISVVDESKVLENY